MFPPDMLAILDRYGRYQLDKWHSGVGTGEIPDLWFAYAGYATDDRPGFLAELGAVLAGDTGGFAAFGASQLVWDHLNDDALHDPAAWPLIDAGIDFKLARGLAEEEFLTGFERQRLRCRPR